VKRWCRSSSDRSDLQTAHENDEVDFDDAGDADDADDDDDDAAGVAADIADSAEADGLCTPREIRNRQTDMHMTSCTRTRSDEFSRTQKEPWLTDMSKAMVNEGVKGKRIGVNNNSDDSDERWRCRMRKWVWCAKTDERNPSNTNPHLHPSVDGCKLAPFGERTALPALPALA
jgi:hypothetical protein